MALWKVMKIWYFKYTISFSITVAVTTGRNPHWAKPPSGETPPPPSAGGRDSDIAVNMEVSDQNCKSYNTIYVFN